MMISVCYSIKKAKKKMLGITIVVKTGNAAYQVVPQVSNGFFLRVVKSLDCVEKS